MLGPFFPQRCDPLPESLLDPLLSGRRVGLVARLARIGPYQFPTAGVAVGLTARLSERPPMSSLG